MTKFIFALTATLLLTACGSSNIEPFLGTWIEVKDNGYEQMTLTVTKDSSDKVNMLHDRIITKTNVTFLVSDEKLVDLRNDQTKFELDGDYLVTVDADPTRYQKK
ncbi:MULTISPECIES: hypothetical protein [unclassified Marinobacter]|uniref:hypothetical protein n=1 Tax=unclassified Marinobacter TaxID=83889 RepID=UPI000BF459A7|nr:MULTISPECIES: hypothetical protein [unclassified Marinobacter]PFG10310.1 hypothetical protein ATI45_2745 [Marinobacter sp. LV10MA510-1]PFG52221.1 hypothetical protein ATG98_1226 [Marinobacter sp. LV10R520-4]